jgi:transcriptional regulator with GAF, ATPase, and Fis domain
MQSLLLEVWRMVGRHLDLPETVDRAYPHLSAPLGLGLLAVRTLDPAASSIETLACATGPGESRPATRSDMAPRALEAVARWCREGAAAHGSAEADSLGIVALLPAGLPAGDLVLVPLPPGEDPAGAASGGVLVAVSSTPAGFDAQQVSVLESLGEPFAAALEGHARLHELRTLREAAEADNRALLARLGRPSVGDVIVGAEGGLRPVLQRLERVARSDVPVLIFGETGTGKEVIARAIHVRSPRASGPMIRVNCGAIPPELIDSELFGHERGSFTGATATRRGWFERADGGTLFLDEVAELPLAAQVRLLRILQDGRFERVGGQTSLTAHVRLVAATHRDLPAMVREGRFREDLWYRICVFPIDLPPLRDRQEDLPALASHFALKAARRLGLPPALPTPDDLLLLAAYPWPGNVRELASVIERAAILGDGRRLEVAAALGYGRATVGAEGAGVGRPRVGSEIPAPPPVAASEGEPLERAVRSHIEAALRATLGRIEGPFGAARRLDVNPHTLRARMRRLGIDWTLFRPSSPPRRLPERPARGR